MLDTSAAWQEAITGEVRRIKLRVILNVIDPDIVYGAITASDEASFSEKNQILDKVMEQSPDYITLEPNRWVFGRGLIPFPDNVASASGEIGIVQNQLGNADGTFSPPCTIQIAFSNVGILQACTVYFSSALFDAPAADFTVEILSNGTAYFSQTVTNNSSKKVSFQGFTVYNPDTLRLTINRWALPGRRARTIEIVPGVYGDWSDDDVAKFNLVQQANFSGLALPYGTCSLGIDNVNRLFEPRNKNGVFNSIEERQGIEIAIGAETDGQTVWQNSGIFYQYNGGWKTGDNGLSMNWELVDIIGLIANRVYIAPATLPTTLSGWIASLVGQLGSNFARRYTVDANYANLPLTVIDAAAVESLKCGDILRYACMATATFPRADAATGNLAVEPYWNQGQKIDLDNLNSYPIMKANDDVAILQFTLSDGSQISVSGNATASDKTTDIQNPFLHDEVAALAAAKLILSTYGGNQIELTGRGNPAGEIGDVDTVWLNESVATTGRRFYQTFAFSGGVLQGCQSTLLQADGAFMFEGHTIITESGTFTAPAGVTALRLILVGGGQGGTAGTDGSFEKAGEKGADGAGGKVWTGTININPGETFTVNIGQGGTNGALGGNTTFGAYSSANGEYYSPSFTDVASGDAFASSAVKAPLAGSGDGGAGGAGGTKGNRYRETSGGNGADIIASVYWVVVSKPGKGQAGIPGASGCVVVYWDKEEENGA